MIRHRRGDEFLLIAQHDHAALAARFANAIGNSRFDGPQHRAEVLDSVALHDAGWPLHDERPTLNARGEPLNVLETGIGLASRVWNESVRIAAERHPYAGLLVSLHVLNLSTLAQQRDAKATVDPVALFELNKFQHRQIEWQEALRRQLRMRTDLPLRLGLADFGTSAEEDQLRFDFALLRLCDSLSLDVCSGEKLFPEIKGIHPKPGASPIALSVGHLEPLSLRLDSWPFGVSQIVETIRAKRLPAKRFESDDAFRAEYEAAPLELLTVRILREL